MFHPDESDLTRVSMYSSESKNIQQVENKAQVISDVELFGSDIVIIQEEFGLTKSEHQLCQQQQLVKELGSLDKLHFDIILPHSRSSGDDSRKIVEPEYQNKQPDGSQLYLFPAASFEVLMKHRNRHQILGLGSNIQPADERLSTGMIIQFAAEKFIQSMPQSCNRLSMLCHPYQCSFVGHSEEDSKGIQLVQNLLSCAERVDEKQHERAIKFLKECDKLSSPTGTPIQRLVFYFSEALFEKIARETGRIMPRGSEKKYMDPLEPVLCPNILIAFHKEHPHSQITKFAGIQAIVDHVKDARKVHVIEFQLRSGVQWIILMQALASRTEHPIHHLKLTVVGTKGKSMLEDTGRQLASFAESLDLKFMFKLVMVEDVLDLQEDLFELDVDETVAVYAAYSLVSMIRKIDQINHVMEVIQNINPHVMVVTEWEVNYNDPTFIGRFVESLFFFGAYFDSLADCMKNDETNRSKAESIWFMSAIRDVLVAEGDERKIRHVNINVWRAFFAHFGLEEVELSLSSLDQATIVLQGFPCRNSCTLHRDGKTLIIGWKGTSLNSLSVWKFK